MLTFIFADAILFSVLFFDRVAYGISPEISEMTTRVKGDQIVKVEKRGVLNV